MFSTSLLQSMTEGCSVWRRHEHLDVLLEDLFGRVAEQALGCRAEGLNETVLVDDDHCVRDGFQDRPQMGPLREKIPLGEFQFGDVIVKHHHGGPGPFAPEGPMAGDGARLSIPPVMNDLAVPLAMVRQLVLDVVERLRKFGPQELVRGLPQRLGCGVAVEPLHAARPEENLSAAAANHGLSQLKGSQPRPQFRRSFGEGQIIHVFKPTTSPWPVQRAP